MRVSLPHERSTDWALGPRVFDLGGSSGPAPTLRPGLVLEPLVRRKRQELDELVRAAERHLLEQLA